MNAQNLINEILALDCFDAVRDAAGVAFDNANAVVGGPYSMTNVSQEYAECFIGTIQGMLCDVGCYGISEEVVAWFNARGIKG